MTIDNQMTNGEYTEKYVLEPIKKIKFRGSFSATIRGVKEHNKRLNEVINFFSHCGLEHSFLNNVKYFKKKSYTGKGKLKKAEIIFNLHCNFLMNSMNYSILKGFSMLNFIKNLKFFMKDKMIVTHHFGTHSIDLKLKRIASVFDCNSNQWKKKTPSILNKDEFLIRFEFPLPLGENADDFEELKFFIFDHFNIYRHIVPDEEISESEDDNF